MGLLNLFRSKNRSKIAVFFDCENISSEHVDFVFSELKKYGEIYIAKAFSDFSKHSGWSKKVQELGIEAVQVFSISGKNSCDLRIVREVMQVKNFAHIDCICLVSSDSDFRDLAMSLRSDGLRTIGFGESKSPKAYKGVYSEFIELASRAESKKSIQNSAPSEGEFIRIISETIVKFADAQGWCRLDTLGMNINSKIYKPKNFGSSSWSKFIAKHPENFELSYLDNGKNNTSIVRLKR